MKFKRGDVVELVDSYPGDRWLGTEFMIAGPLQFHPLAGCLVHQLERDGDSSHFAPPENLRLKRPPSWDSWIYDTRDVEREYFAPGPVEHINCRCVVLPA